MCIDLVELRPCASTQVSSGHADMCASTLSSLESRSSGSHSSSVYRYMSQSGSISRLGICMLVYVAHNANNTIASSSARAHDV